jgi:hypothetical protein
LTDILSLQPTGVLVGIGAAAIARLADSPSEPLDVWLSGGLFLDDGAPVNVLAWWAEQKRNGNTHHGLLQMALDVMCCPGENVCKYQTTKLIADQLVHIATTVDVERTFSFGQDYVSVRRHNLNPKSVSRGMALSFNSKNGKVKPLSLHKYLEKRKDDLKSKTKQKNKAVDNDVVMVE